MREAAKEVESSITVKIPLKWRRKNNRSLGQIKSHLEKELSKAESTIYNHKYQIERLHKKMRVLEEKIDTVEMYMMRNKAKSCPCLKRIRGTTYRCLYKKDEAPIEHWDVECSTKCKVRHPETRILVNKLKIGGKR